MRTFDARSCRPAKRVRRFALACAVVLLIGRARALADSAHSPPVERDVSSLLNPILEKHHVTGLAAALVEGDTVTEIGASGVRRVGQSEKLETSDVFHLGSCTKAMTATVIALLVEEGTLSWDSTIEGVFPREQSKMSKQFAAVTLAQLLYHRGGLASDTSPDDAWRAMRKHTGEPIDARHELTLMLAAKPPAHPPGARFEYSNAAYVIAAHMAEQATGKPFEKLLRERLFEPLGIASAGFGEPYGEHVAWGHNADGSGVAPGPNADNPPAYNPSGRVRASLADWGKFVSLHLRGQHGKLKLAPASIKMLHEAVADESVPYAMGWIEAPRPWAGGKALTHSGTNTHWFAVAWLAPQRDFAVLIVCNQGGDAAQQACDDAAGALIADRSKHR